MLRQMLSVVVGKKRFVKPLKITVLKNLMRCSTTSSSSNSVQAMSRNAKKGFVLYHYLTFSIRSARLMTICGMVACGAASYVSMDLHEMGNKVEQEVSEEPAEESIKQVYQGILGMIAPYLYAGAGIAMFFIARKMVNSTAKKILLSTDRETVTFVSYRLFGNDKILTVPVKDVSWKGSKIKVDNYLIKYHLMKSGTITNRSLLLWSLNTYQGPHVDPEIFKGS